MKHIKKYKTTNDLDIFHIIVLKVYVNFIRIKKKKLHWL